MLVLVRGKCNFLPLCGFRFGPVNAVFEFAAWYIMCYKCTRKLFFSSRARCPPCVCHPSQAGCLEVLRTTRILVLCFLAASDVCDATERGQFPIKLTSAHVLLAAIFDPWDEFFAFQYDADCLMISSIKECVQQQFFYCCCLHYNFR